MPVRGAVEVSVECRPRRGRRTAELFERVAAIAVVREAPAGRMRATFVLDATRRGFGTLASLLAEIGDRRSTTVWVDREAEGAGVVQEMAECARSFAMSPGSCQFPFSYSVPDRCRACPLYDAERAEAMIAASYADTGTTG
jgi:hypothetical protein